MELDNLKRISKLQDDLIESMNKNIGYLIEIKKLKGISINTSQVLTTTYEPPRRSRVDLFVPAEKAIYDAVDEVEKMAADIRLTEAVILLNQAFNKVADYVDDINK